MATAQYGAAYLDIYGNRVVWSSADKTHDNILLVGSQFHDIIPMVTLVISAICGIAFVILTVAVCAVWCSRQGSRKYLSQSFVMVPIFCMICYFAIDIGNRVFHELSPIITSGYLAIDIPMGSVASIAEGLLMIYLLNKSPVGIIHGRPRKMGDMYAAGIGVIGMTIAIVVYFIAAIANKGTAIWALLFEIEPSGSFDKRYVVVSSSSGYEDDGEDYLKSMKNKVHIAEDLATAAVGMLLLFALGFLFYSITFLRHLPDTRKRMKWTVGILTGSYVIRNAVMFVFTLVYAQFDHIASPGIQLVYMVVHGLLSVVIYVSILVVAGVQEKEEPLVENAKYGPVKQTVVDDRVSWQQSKPQVNVISDPYPSPYGSYPYYQQNGSQQRW